MASVSLATDAPAPDEQRFRLGGVDWATYRKIADALTGRHVRLTYDRGNLEFMTISSKHGRLSRLIARLIGVLTEELSMTICTCGDMTCEREDLERALEPDEAFYLENEPLIRDKEQIDLTVDPPPDLAAEVELSPAHKSRMGLYAALRISEVWRYDGAQVTLHQLGTDGQYAIVAHSPHFPFVSGADLARFLEQRTQLDENALVRLFREWVREQIRSLGKQP